jgi:SAM-dependent methyltransferase
VARSQRLDVKLLEDGRRRLTVRAIPYARLADIVGARWAAGREYDDAMARKFQATESRDVDTVLEKLPEVEAYVRRIVARMRPFMALPAGAAVLDLGAAQGASAVAYIRAGFVAWGVEPWEPAIEVSRELTARTGVQLEILHGVGEALPFADESFDFVHANSVMEHVDDPWQVFREVYRTLRPGGGFLFGTNSSMGLRQSEIGRFPLFAWYPQRAQRAIMAWAVRERPWLVGYTTRPAIHWFRHRDVKVALSAIGFTRVVDRWAIRSRSGELSGPKKLVVDGAASSTALRLAADALLGGLQYLAIK